MDNQKRIQEIEAEMSEVHNRLHVKQQGKKFDTSSKGFQEYLDFINPETERLAELRREKQMLKTPELKRDIPEYGDVMSLQDFVDAVKDGGFIDYDGSGEYVKDGKMSGIAIHPSDVQYGAVRDDFDTIVWFNR